MREIVVLSTESALIIVSRSYPASSRRLANSARSTKERFARALFSCPCARMSGPVVEGLDYGANGAAQISGGFQTAVSESYLVAPGFSWMRSNENRQIWPTFPDRIQERPIVVVVLKQAICDER